MKRKRKAPLRALILSVLISTLPSSITAAQDIGPSGGTLLIVGGGSIEGEIVERFLESAGGPDAPVVVIPTAGSGDSYDGYWPGLRLFREAGARNLTVLHTRDRRVSDSEPFVEPIRKARAVWFSGGRQWRLADAYLNTRVHEELWNLLARGGVIGGSSAGATIQGSYLARGDTRTNTVMMGDHQEGMGFLKNTAIDQHLLKRNRHFDLIEIIEARPELLGLGIDEGTAIVVRGNLFEVIGRGYVAVYDHNTMLHRGRFYFLSPGDRYNLNTRTPMREAYSTQPFDRLRAEEWEIDP